MQLKAIYSPAAGQAGKVVKDKLTGADLVCTGVHLIHSGKEQEQNFNRRTFVLDGLTEGWLSLVEDDEKGTGVLTLHTANDGDVVYDVLQIPGYYCRSTGERIPLSKMAEEESFTSNFASLAAGEARKWLQAKKLPMTIKVPNYPGSKVMVEQANYEATKDYKCRLRPEFHGKLRGVPGPAGNLVRIGTQFKRRDGTVFTVGAEA